MLFSIAVCILMVATATGQVLDNRDTCTHRVQNCDPSVDHFETKISMDHSSSVSKLEYKNTHVLLDQSWPTRGPWMKSTSQKVVFVRCGCPVPDLSEDWNDANVIHIPVSSVMVQMPNALSKIYLMGQRSKVAAIESDRWISDATPEIATDLRDGTVQRLDRSLNAQPSTRITLSFSSGLFPDNSAGFKLHLVDESSTVLGETECIYPTASESSDPLNDVLDRAFNSIPGWVDAGDVWVLSNGEASATPSTSLSYALYFDNQLPMGLSLRGEASTCGSNVEFNFERDSAPSNHPIYHRLHNLPGGFPDVLITEPRSLGPLAEDPKVQARLFIDSDPGEETPLGRAELMKLTALMVGSVSTGNALFESIEMRYNDAKAIAAKAKHRPTVMVGKPGTWNEAARNSWMITVGSTYVGQFLRDANVEYRNSDDAVNKEICGSGCGVCPSGTSDTRCSVPIDEYLDLFRSADYWISAGIGANCWSASCNFEITADELLNQNRQVFSQFLSMQCGSVIALDKAHNSGNSGNSYWETARLRPDLVLMDLVTLMHPDVMDVQGEETTFFRMLPPPSDRTGVEVCPRTSLPVTPEQGTVHVTSRFMVNTGSSSSGVVMETIGAPHFAVLDRFYPTANEKVAEALDVDVADLEMAMTNTMQEDTSTLGVDVTVRVSNCQNHACGVEVGQKLNALGSEELEKALDLPGVSVEQDLSRPTLVLDRGGDIIPLMDLVTDDERVGSPCLGTSEAAENESSLSSGAIVGTVVGVLAAFVIGMIVMFNAGVAKGKNVSASSHGRQEQGNKVEVENGPML